MELYLIPEEAFKEKINEFKNNEISLKTNFIVEWGKGKTQEEKRQIYDKYENKKAELRKDMMKLLGEQYNVKFDDDFFINLGKDSDFMSNSIKNILDAKSTYRENMLKFYNLLSKFTEDPKLFVDYNETIGKLIKNNNDFESAYNILRQNMDKIVSEEAELKITSRFKDLIQKTSDLQNLAKNLDKCKKTVENENKFHKFGMYGFATLSVLLIAFYVLQETGVIKLSNLKQRNLKQRNAKQRELSEVVNTTKDDIKATILAWYANNISGCYLIRNDGMTRLDGCSNLYTNSRENCSCGIINVKMMESNCDNSDECLKPYCIGNSKCNTSTKCSSEKLYQCAGNNISDPNYISYMYIDNSMFSLFNNLVEFYDKNKQDDTSKINILLYVIIFVVVIFIISFVIFLMKRSKKYKKRN